MPNSYNYLVVGTNNNNNIIIIIIAAERPKGASSKTIRI